MNESKTPEEVAKEIQKILDENECLIIVDFVKDVVFGEEVLRYTTKIVKKNGNGSPR